MQRAPVLSIGNLCGLHSISRRAILMISLSLWIALFVGFSFNATAPAQAQDDDAEPTPAPLMPPDQEILQQLFERTNALRARYNRHPYVRNEALDRAAQDQAEWLVRTRSRSHFRRDGSRPSTRAAAAGFQTGYWCCGENYYMSIDATPDMVFDFWRYSPSHVVNVLHREFTDMGLGMTSDGYRISYVTVFGRAGFPEAAVETIVDTEQPTEPAPEPPAEAPGEASALAAPEEAAPPPVSYIEYYAAPGDTLSRIAARFGTTVSALVELNNIANPNFIYEAQRILIPTTDSP